MQIEDEKTLKETIDTLKSLISGKEV
jgi:hypothetical protein